ncbi:MAG TPA: MarR family transcriptional regulator [Oceanospirillales bacterium]|nr:MarR family transcriptional regulator [Oceanospirillales bacterium]
MKNSNAKFTRRSFIGKQADDLGNLISIQIKPIYDSLGIIVPVKSCSIIHQLKQSKQASLADLAKLLNQSHQLVNQKLPRLLKLNLINKKNDINDKRRKIFYLTAKGMQQAALLEKHSLSQVYDNLSQELGADLYQVLSSAISQLKQKNLLSRFEEVHNK